MSLRQLLQRLSTDEGLLKRFREDPAATMTDLGVSAEDQEIMVSQDRVRLAEALRPEKGEEDLEFDFARFF